MDEVAADETGAAGDENGSDGRPPREEYGRCQTLARGTRQGRL